MKKIRFFNLNIKHRGYSFEKGLSAAEYWLDVRQRAPVFYGPNTAEEFLAGIRPDGLGTRALGELMRFLGVQEEGERDSVRNIFVTIDSGSVWLYEPVGPVRSDPLIKFDWNGKPAEDCPKAYSIHMVVPKFSVSEVPMVVASMKSNQAFCRGTFTAIEAADQKKNGRRGYDGNLAALYSLINIWPDDMKVDPLEGLSSVELETLVAKIFEELGCFVPAYRGGLLPMVDLFLHLPKGGVKTLPSSNGGGRLSVQIKLNIESKSDWEDLQSWTEKSSENVLLTLQPSRRVPPNIRFRSNSLLTREWLLTALSNCPASRTWLEQVLSWLPMERRKLT